MWSSIVGAYLNLRLYTRSHTRLYIKLYFRGYTELYYQIVNYTMLKWFIFARTEADDDQTLIKVVNLNAKLKCQIGIANLGIRLRQLESLHFVTLLGCFQLPHLVDASGSFIMPFLPNWLLYSFKVAESSNEVRTTVLMVSWPKWWGTHDELSSHPGDHRCVQLAADMVLSEVFLDGVSRWASHPEACLMNCGRWRICNENNYWISLNYHTLRPVNLGGQILLKRTRESLIANLIENLMKRT